MSFFSCAVFSSLLIIAFRKKEQAGADTCWQADDTVTLIQAYVRKFSKSTLTCSLSLSLFISIFSSVLGFTATLCGPGRLTYGNFMWTRLQIVRRAGRGGGGPEDPLALSYYVVQVYGGCLRTWWKILG